MPFIVGIWMARNIQVAGKHLIHKPRRHMTVEEVAAFLGHGLSAEERKAGIKHLSQCRRCRGLLARVVRSEKARNDPERS
ncbi:MAG TPA: hypothetical protein VN658_00740 [Candidatus Acidoferrales bacterium]|nr:hypothetical protein [Candidatus Acidoferrales bacterium]